MIGMYPGKFWRYCWKYITPCCITFIFLMGVYGYAPLEVIRTNHVYAYPLWSNIFGWIIVASSCMFIPLVAFYQYFIKSKGSLKQVKFFSSS